MKLNLAANRDNPNTKLDLHFLQSEEAEKKLGQFLREWETRLGVTERQWLEIVTGRGAAARAGGLYCGRQWRAGCKIRGFLFRGEPRLFEGGGQGEAELSAVQTRCTIYWRDTKK